jgi:hypothetical protein
MNMKKLFRPIVVIAALVLVLGVAGSLGAATITGFNTGLRPVEINPPSVLSEATIQQIMDTYFPAAGVNVFTDQQTAAVFQTAGSGGAGNTFPQLLAEYSGNAGLHIFGIWTGYDTTVDPTRVPIFTGAANPLATAAIQWTNPTTIQIADPFGSGGINVGTFAGISQTWFGFYYQFGDTILYTYDGLNTPQVVGGYNGAHTAAILGFNIFENAAWVFACDDLGVEPDYNDMVVKVESIRPVPVPPSVLLLGSGLLGLGLIGWRRRKS